jgi:hypothetical protein
MIRPAPPTHTDTIGDFRLRGREVSRVEALTDGVFALAMTLLIVSVEVPATFAELVAIFPGLPAFAACFAIMMWFWVTHHRFFRRYGLNDGTMMFLNSVLLFVVLIYVYPLKFLFSLFIAAITGMGGSTADLNRTMPVDRLDELFVVYSGGFGLVWLLFGLMHWHAYRRRKQLELGPVERLLTRAEIGRSIALVTISGLSIVLALTMQGIWVTAAGWVYGLIGPVEGVHGWSVGRRKARLVAKLATGSADPPSGTAHPPPG